MCNDDNKLYLEESVLEKKMLDIDLRVLVEMPNGIDYNEWLASHSKFKKLFVIIFNKIIS